MVHPISCHLSLCIAGSHLRVLQTAKDLKEQSQNINFCAVASDILVTSMNTLQYPISLWTFCTVLIYNFNAMDNSQIVNAKFAKISSTIRASFTFVRDGVGLTTAIIVDLLFDYC
jgi:hypothetical protein